MFNVKVLSDNASTVKCWWTFPIDTLDWHLKQYTIKSFPVDTWFNSHAVSRVLTNSYASIENYSTPNQLSIERPVIVNQGVDGVLIE